MGLVRKVGSSGEAIRPYVAPARAEAAQAGDAQEKRLQTLRRQKEQAEADLATERSDRAEAEERAREQGRREGVKAARADEEKRIAAIESGIAAALDAWSARLASLDALAASITRAALAALFDESEDYAEFVVRAIARQAAILNREAIVSVRVSPKDFPDADALAAIRERMPIDSYEIAAAPALKSGECRIDLRLGHIDLGVGTQWRHLAALLDELAGAE